MISHRGSRSLSDIILWGGIKSVIGNFLQTLIQKWKIEGLSGHEVKLLEVAVQLMVSPT